uniref:Uncharacterized protein n=1 Tax=Glossina brevipalpis TaxID=37001 RepID=A0A1A9WNE8_9MUSC
MKSINKKNRGKDLNIVLDVNIGCVGVSYGGGGVALNHLTGEWTDGLIATAGDGGSMARRDEKKKKRQHGELEERQDGKMEEKIERGKAKGQKGEATGGRQDGGTEEWRNLNYRSKLKSTFCNNETLKTGKQTVTLFLDTDYLKPLQISSNCPPRPPNICCDRITPIFISKQSSLTQRSFLSPVLQSQFSATLLDELTEIKDFCHLISQI